MPSPDDCDHRSHGAGYAASPSRLGARRIAVELARKGVTPAPSESAVYRCVVRAAVIDRMTRRRRRETWKRWELAAPMELWQLDVMDGFLPADGTSARALTGIDTESAPHCAITRRCWCHRQRQSKIH